MDPDKDCEIVALKQAIVEVVEAFHEAIAEGSHDFDMSDDAFMSEKRRRLMYAIAAADCMAE
jgi:hypothetical protein